jgi:hypothetical protein
MGKATRFTTRKEIRYAITQLLNDRMDCTAYANRVRPIGVEELPIILIYPTSLDYTILRKDPNRLLGRDMTLSIQVIATDSREDMLSDILDDLSEQIEETIENSDKLGQLVHDINIDTAQGSYKDEGQKPEGAWIMNYNITFIKKPKE